ncbi:hypothetical protein AZE41_08205 [Sporosarcina psychrophila]|nr:hypothetical protein AZE41_08205 [Sporosarcina psychrophila]
MNSNRICSCGKLVATGTKCPCKKRNTAASDHISGHRKFQTLRKKIVLREKGHCQRCRIKHDLLITADLECHHIKSYRDFPELAYDENNLIMVCRQCNLDLGNNNKLDFNVETLEEVEYYLLIL